MQYRSNDLTPLPLREAREALDVYLKDEKGKAHVVRAASEALRSRRKSLAVRELVADVVGDTFTGALTWDRSAPSANGLSAMTIHLIAEVRRRAWRLRRVARTFVSDDEVPDVRDADADAEADVEANAQLARLDRVLPVLRERASGDALVAQLLALNERGILRKVEGVREGMSARDYHNARRRLVALALRIDAETTGVTADDAATPIANGQIGTRRRVAAAA